MESKSNPHQNYSGSTSTVNSASEGRLKIDVKGKKKLLKTILNKYNENNR